MIDLLGGGIDERTMRRLNRLVDDEGRDARDVAAELLKTRGWSEP